MTDLNWAPDVCTLPTVERPLREAEFDELFRDALRAIRRQSPIHADLELDGPSAGRARDLAARETSCCSFFTFEFTEAGGGVTMAVTVPPSQAAVLNALIESAARSAGRSGVEDAE